MCSLTVFIPGVISDSFHTWCDLWQFSEILHLHTTLWVHRMKSLCHRFYPWEGNKLLFHQLLTPSLSSVEASVHLRSAYRLCVLNRTISSFTLHNITPLITNSAMGGQIITQLERDNLLSLWSIILMQTCPGWRES